MKNLILAGLTTLALLSCENREDYFSSVNNPPEVTIKNPRNDAYETEISDSLKIGCQYSIAYKISDEESITATFESLGSRDTILKVKEGVLKVITYNEGLSIIKIKANDSFNKEGAGTVELINFRNLKPVARFKILQIKGNSPYEIEINASESYDQDKKWGGKITEYLYIIDNKFIPSMPYNNKRELFDSPGQKKVVVKVKDNNGEWSDEVVEYINVQ